MTQAQEPAEKPAAAAVSFPALRHPGFRIYFVATALAMMADSVEHVITYWVMYQKFHSQTLAGFAVVSHWLPFLLFSVYSGALADRFDPRRIIQLGMLVSMTLLAGGASLFVGNAYQARMPEFAEHLGHGDAGVAYSMLLAFTLGSRPR